MPTVRRASVQENRSTCSLRSRSSSNEYIVRLLGGWTEVAFAFSFCSFVAIGSVHESAANKRLENPQGENLFRRELGNVLCDYREVGQFAGFDRTFIILFKFRIGSLDSVASQRLFECQPLFGMPPAGRITFRILPSDCGINSIERIQGLAREI